MHTRPKDQLLRMLEQTLIPPTSVTELDPDTIDAATSRMGDVRGTVAESYIVNSELTPAGLNRLPDEETRRHVRNFYFETTLNAFQQLHAKQSRWTMHASKLPPQMQALLSPLWSNPAAVDAMYSVDVLLLVDGSVWRCVPGAPGFMLEREWTDAQQAQIVQATPGQSLDEADGLIFLIGHIARTSYLVGDRAVRSIGLTAGAVAGALFASGASNGVSVRVVDVFVDAVVNKALSCDGVDRAVTTILQLKVPPTAATSNPPADEDRRPNQGPTDESRPVDTSPAVQAPRASPLISIDEPDEAAVVASRWAALPDVARASILELIASTEDIVTAGRTASLRRVTHRMFERSVQEFFTAEQSSTQLPNDLVRFTAPHPRGIALPGPDPDVDEVVLVEALAGRRSVRSFDRESLTVERLGSMLHLASARNGTEDGYGVRDMPKFPYPSIGGLDSTELGVVVQRVEGVEPGYYLYDKVGHALVPVLKGDLRLSVVNATFESQWLFYAPVIAVLVNDQTKVAWKYKTRGYRISHLDQGALLQTLTLSAVAHGLGTCAVAGYLDDKINQMLGLTERDAFVTALLAVGHPNRLGHGS